MLFQESETVRSRGVRSNIVCLVVGWEDAYPGQKFNKFHAAFCDVRNYVHKYHIAGRVNKESTEAFNAVLEK